MIVTVSRRNHGSSCSSPLGLADSGDGTGEGVLLFRGSRLLGWASDRLAAHAGLSNRGTAIEVRYGGDPLCCPHGTKTVRYRGKAKRIVARAKPPKVYGLRMHLSRR